jgi:lipopolysaccharide transport protein LptA
MFRGLRLSQGQIGVSADQGRASKLDFQDSVWRFEGNVVIDVEDGHIECASADLKFTDHTLRLASIKGSPATFALRRPGSDEVTYGEAGQLEYDLSTGIVEFAGNATITEGGNQISSGYLVYNIAEQRINAQSTGNGDEKVKITSPPGNNKAPDNETDAGAGDP